MWMEKCEEWGVARCYGWNVGTRVAVGVDVCRVESELVSVKGKCDDCIRVKGECDCNYESNVVNECPDEEV